MAKRDYLVTTDWTDETGVRCIISARDAVEVQDKYPSVRILADESLDTDPRARAVSTHCRIDIDDIPRGVFASIIAEHRKWRLFYIECVTDSGEKIRRQVFAPSQRHVEDTYPSAEVVPIQFAPVDTYGVEFLLFDDPDEFLRMCTAPK